jgi:hypothetical protein
MSNPLGKWDATLEGALEIVGVHAVVLHTGKVLFWCFAKDIVGKDQGSDEFKNLFNDPNQGSFQIWDPTTVKAPPSQPIGRNSFCAGQCALADGTILIAGGQDGAGASELSGEFDKYLSELFGDNDNGALKDLHVFDPATETWDRWADMADGRYYPTCQILPDGSAFVAGGLANLAKWTASASNWGENGQFEKVEPGTFFATPPQPFAQADQYPMIKLLPGTNKLFVHIETVTMIFDLDTASFIPAAIFIPPSPDAAGHPVGRQTYPMQTGHVLLPQKEGDKPRIFVVGGSTWTHFDVNAGYLITPDFVKSAPAVLGAFIFDFEPSNPLLSKWRATAGPPAAPRLLVDLVLLPDGTVFVVNGIKGGAAAGHSQDALVKAEIFDPMTEVFLPADTPDTNHPRGYHSAAFLMPDGRVAISGNTATYNPGEPSSARKDDVSIQIYNPPYLFNGPRPVVTGVPAQIGYGSSLHLDTSAGPPVASAMLMRPCAVTHSVDMDQRAIILGVSGGAGTVDVKIPSDKSLAPPGFYMLFLLSADKTPSIASWVQLVDEDPTFPPIDLGAYVGPCVIEEVFDGDLTLDKVDQHVDLRLESRHGSITIKHKINQHSYANLKAAGGVTIGEGIDQHSTVEIVCGGDVTIGQTINEYSWASITTPGKIEIGQKVDNSSGAVLNAGSVHIGQTVDQHSTAQIHAQGNVTIDQKIDQHSTADITSVNGNVHIGQKLDEYTISSITAQNGSIRVVQGMSGSATATLKAPHGTITMDTIDSGCTLDWSATSLNCPHQNGSVTEI